ncbi:phage tail protein, partial [Escherichia coli O8:H49]
RTELELKAAATMEPQSDIRDRTPGRLALPGAFGFGYAFSQYERLVFNSDKKFLEWVKNATEGRYFIYSYNSKIFPDRDSFTGVVDVNLFPSGVSDGNPAQTDKGLFFYSRYQSNSDQSVFYAQYSSAYADGVVTWGLTSVRNLSLTSKMLSEFLSRTVGTNPYSYYKYPAV